MALSDDQKRIKRDRESRVRELHAKGLSDNQIGDALGISRPRAREIRVGMCLPRVFSEPIQDDPTPNPPAVGNDTLSERILARLRAKNASVTFENLCDEFDSPPKKIRAIIEEFKDRHFNVNASPGGAIFIGGGQEQPAEPPPVLAAEPGQTIRFGFITDTHLCNVNYRDDVANALYDEFAADGIGVVFHAGNTVDGEAPFNRTELVTPPGFENQIGYFLDNYPARDSITTYFIDGDDHEGWYGNRHGICFGRRLQQDARDRGRNDLVYLGFQRVEVAYATPSGGRCVVRIEHPGMGSAYADSYMIQKMVEAIDPAQAPHVLLYGHYHKSIYDHVRRIHTIGGGCVCDATTFMRKKRLRADVGGWTVEMQVNETGAITKFLPRWMPFPQRTQPIVAQINSSGAASVGKPIKYNLNY
jgi:hypothetical protein